MPLKFKGINTSKYELEEFILAIFYIPSFDHLKAEVYAYIRCELYLFDGLKANMLIGNNVLGTESCFINLDTSLAHVGSCNIDIYISAKHLLYFLNRKVLANTTTFIPPKSEALVSLKQMLLPDS